MKKIYKTIKKIQNKPENEKIRIMWILVILCMIIMIGIWKINLELNKETKINPTNSNTLNFPPFPELKELNEEIDSIEKLEEELLEENKIEEELED